MTDIAIEKAGHVAIVEIRRPENNYFDERLIREIAGAYEELDRDAAVRCAVLCSQGKNFCAGANFVEPSARGDLATGAAALYRTALRLFRTATPTVAALQGATIGGGLGLALTADFRVADANSRFSANFNRLGIHPGFGLTETLPALVGMQQATRLFFTGRRIAGEEALRMGLVDALAEVGDIRAAAMQLAEDIALSAPVAVTSTRQTLRCDLADRIAAAVEREAAQQAVHFAMRDFREGVQAATERRHPVFTGE